MDSFIDLVKKRRSIRQYRPDEVPREMIESCIEAVRYAPSASNTQGWRFFIVEGEMKEKLIKESLGGMIVPNKWAFTAPVVVALAMKLSVVTHRIGAKMKAIDYHMVDAGIAGEHFILRAAEFGLGTCWIGWFNKKAVRKLLKIPSDWDIPALITVGFPAEGILIGAVTGTGYAIGYIIDGSFRAYGTRTVYKHDRRGTHAADLRYPIEPTMRVTIDASGRADIEPDQRGSIMAED